ncbi:hypothetical protein GCM10010103_62050 [Streptomyces paradoxus]|uniref:Uncharacterized protein n=1 Tax=Streptomyces paradoxus TaxID=66375 RepID=A0A7W9TKT5_9ACTN|nr:hypothetical protein [Streptomyces paradoxus]MBB6081197.1 hypothetical protein [Streptomyces paradoxus]
MSKANRDAADAVVGEAITTVEQAHARFHQGASDPGQIARRARQQEVIEPTPGSHTRGDRYRRGHVVG